MLGTMTAWRLADGNDAETETLPTNPFKFVTWSEDWAELPCIRLTDEGATETVNPIKVAEETNVDQHEPFEPQLPVIGS